MIDYLTIARAALARTQGVSVDERLRANERNETNEESPPPPSLVAAVRPTIPSVVVPEPSPYQSPLDWQRANAARLTAADVRAGRDVLSVCRFHHRFLGYFEQKHGACVWCVPKGGADP